MIYEGTNSLQGYNAYISMEVQTHLLNHPFGRITLMNTYVLLNGYVIPSIVSQRCKDLERLIGILFDIKDGVNTV